MPQPVRKEDRPLTEREKRVAEIRKRVAEGMYQIDSLELSKAILKRHLAPQDPELKPED